MHLCFKLMISSCALALIAASPASAASLLSNGDFEVLDGRIGSVRGKALNALDSGRWDVYDALPGGWYTSDGAGIEVEYSGTVVDAYSGNHYVELDSHPGPDSNSSMSIDLMLDGGDYRLDFMYTPRTSVLGDNGIRVLVDEVEVLSIDDFRQPGTDWEQYTLALLGLDAGLHTLTFSAFGIENTLGGFLDDISLESTTAPIPEPSAALVFSLGLLLVVHNQRQVRA